MGGTTPLPMALLATVRAWGIGWWGAAVPDSVPLLTALVAGQRWFLRQKRGSRGSLLWEGLSNGKSHILSVPF